MSEVKKLFDVLSSDKTKTHKDIKFFLGEQGTDVEEIARQCRLAIEQDNHGVLKVW
jgi:hypothetical protein